MYSYTVPGALPRAMDISALLRKLTQVVITSPVIKLVFVILKRDCAPSLSWQLLWKPHFITDSRDTCCAGLRQQLYVQESSFSWRISHLCIPKKLKSVGTRVHAHTHTRITSSSTCRRACSFPHFTLIITGTFFSLSSCGGELCQNF